MSLSRYNNDLAIHSDILHDLRYYCMGLLSHSPPPPPPHIANKRWVVPKSHPENCTRVNARNPLPRPQLGDSDRRLV